jgi:hypothetical protein
MGIASKLPTVTIKGRVTPEESDKLRHHLIREKMTIQDWIRVQIVKIKESK